MTDLNTYYPLIWKLRTGDNNDPYVEKTDRCKVINGKMVLHEIPSFSYKIDIDGMYEISKDEFEESNGVLAENKYYVDYQGSFIYVNESNNGKYFNVRYLGTGIAQIPAERIWVHADNPYAVDNLQDYIDKCGEFVASCKEELESFQTNLEHYYNDYVKKINESHNAYMIKLDSIYKQYQENINILYDNFIEKINKKVIEFNSYINEYIIKANEKIDEIDKQIKLSEKTLAEVLSSLAECLTATKNCIEQTDIAKRLNGESQDLINKMKEEIQNCKDFLTIGKNELDKLKKDRLSTVITWKYPVDTFIEILNTYPNPQIGDTVQTRADGKAYRWDGSNWCFVLEFTANTNLVTNTEDGIMRSEDYVKLQTVEVGAEKNLEGEELKYSLPDYMKERTIIMYLGDKPKIGEGIIETQFPFKGRILELKASAKLAGDDVTELFAEKISESDYEKNLDKWVQINDSNTPLMFKPLKKVTEKGVAIINKDVNVNDYFRIKLTKLSTNIKNITVYIKIVI